MKNYLLVILSMLLCGQLGAAQLEMSVYGAAHFGNVDRLKELLDAGGDPNERLLCVPTEPTALFNAHLDCVPVLIQAGADVSAERVASYCKTVLSFRLLQTCHHCDSEEKWKKEQEALQCLVQSSSFWGGLSVDEVKRDIKEIVNFYTPIFEKDTNRLNNLKKQFNKISDFAEKSRPE